MNRGILLSFGIFIAIVISASIFLLSRKEKILQVNSSPVPSSIEVTTSVDSSVTPGETVREIVISGGEFSFSPASIQLKLGERVKLTFMNDGNFEHDFIINELGVKTKKIEPGESDTVEFIATKVGTFTFYCGVGDHQDLGMEGQLVVTQ
jgi:uncharacterized cupredoxin-like copper-binding protein